MKKIKNFKFYAGISALVTGMMFIVLFFILYSEKKSLAKTFAALATVSGFTGAMLLIMDAKEKSDKAELILDEELECDDFDFDCLDDEDIDCSFEESNQE